MIFLFIRKKQVFCELMRIVRPFKAPPIRENDPGFRRGGPPTKPSKSKKDKHKKCAIL